MFNVSIIGSGNVGSHLYNALTKSNVQIDAVWSRNIDHAKAIDLKAATNSLDFSKSESDLFIIAIKDDAIHTILAQLKLPEHSILVHTSGTENMGILKIKSTKHGIFYPLQTFTKGGEVNYREIPFLLEASDSETLIQLKTLAHLISENVMECNSEKRKHIHLAAVFACNFTNKLLNISEGILNENDLDLDILKPLIKETIQKSFELGPKNSQTGPAARGDKKTIAKHLEMLGDNSENQKLYQLISDMIMKG